MFDESTKQLPKWVAEIAVAFNFLMNKPNFRRAVRDALCRWAEAHKRCKRARAAWQRKRDQLIAAMTEKPDYKLFDPAAKLGDEYEWDHHLTLRQIATDDQRVATFCEWMTVQLRKKSGSMKAAAWIHVKPWTDCSGVLSHSFGAWVPRALHSKREPLTPSIFPLPTVEDDREMSRDEKLIALLAIREIGMRGLRSRSTASSHGPLTSALFYVTERGVPNLVESDEPILRSWLEDVSRARRGRPKGTRKYPEKLCRRVFKTRKANPRASWETIGHLVGGIPARKAKQIHDSYRHSEDAQKSPSTPSN